VERSGTRRRKLGSTSFHPTYEWYFLILAKVLSEKPGFLGLHAYQMLGSASLHPTYKKMAM